jgi:hypothetical protein
MLANIIAVAFSAWVSEDLCQFEWVNFDPYEHWNEPPVYVMSCDENADPLIWTHGQPLSEVK